MTASAPSMPAPVHCGSSKSPRTTRSCGMESGIASGRLTMAVTSCPAPMARRATCCPVRPDAPNSVSFIAHSLIAGRSASCCSHFCHRIISFRIIPGRRPDTKHCSLLATDRLRAKRQLVAGGLRCSTGLVPAPAVHSRPVAGVAMIASWLNARKRKRSATKAVSDWSRRRGVLTALRSSRLLWIWMSMAQDRPGSTGITVGCVSGTRQFGCCA
jgi:hypothetical protein